MLSGTQESEVYKFKGQSSHKNDMEGEESRSCQELLKDGV